MVFSSSTFIFVFLPIVMGLYFLFPNRKLKNIWLLIASLFFYAWGEPVYVVLMLFAIFVNWLFALLLDKESLAGHRKSLLASIVIIDIAIIGFFKYEGFIADSINALIGTALVPNLELPLPIGISFYTLQALSYVIDVYKKEVAAQRNILYLGMYVACFPQLIAGPIVRYSTIEDQIINRKESLADVASGLRLFIVGLGKKVILANTVAIIAADMLAAGGVQIGAVGAWGGLIAYTFQIYFDFSGYSDMAIGLGRMMGFRYLRNFNYPYISQSITEFWRRWHISLSTFFRDYIYIPLGGSRVSKGRWVFNIAVVWATTGLWHGAAWNFVLWGVYYGALLVFEKLCFRRVLDKLPAFLCHLYAILVFMFGWLIFWVPDMSQMGVYLQAMFGVYGATGTETLWQLNVWEYWPVFVACAVASTPIVPYIKERFAAWVEGRPFENFAQTSVVNPRCYDSDSLCVFQVQPVSSGKAHAVLVGEILVDILLICIAGMSIASIVSGSFNPFIYFKF